MQTHALKFVLFFGLILSCLSLWNAPEALAFRVSPGAFCMQGTEPGKDTDLGLDLIIKSDSSEEQVFTVKALKPSAAVAKLTQGYSEIPDADWFYLDKNEIKIGPKGEGKLRMHLKIPDEEQYYNQRWMVFLEVASEAAAGSMFRAAIKAGYMIETKSKPLVTRPPHGRLGLVPATVKIEDTTPGQSRPAAFKIYNNDEIKHTYAFTSWTPRSAQKLDITVSPGYEWAQAENWVRIARRKITLEPGASAEIKFSAAVPNDKTASDAGWEAIIMAEPEAGPAGFVRVQMEMKEKEMKGGGATAENK